MVPPEELREGRSERLSWLSIISAAGAALTLLGFLDRSTSLAKWAQWMIDNWLQLNRALWGTLLWFWPSLTVTDASALTLCLFVIGTLWGSSVANGQPTKSRWSAWFAAAAGAAAIVGTIGYSSYVFYRAETMQASLCSVYTELDEMLKPEGSSFDRRRELTKCFNSVPQHAGGGRVGGLAQVTDAVRGWVSSISPYAQCSSNYLRQMRDAFMEHRKANDISDADAVKIESFEPVLEKAGLWPPPVCQNNENSWRNVVAPTAASIAIPLAFLSVVIAVPIVLLRLTAGRVISAQRLAKRVWLILAFAYAVVAINIISQHAEAWLKSYGITLPG